MAIAYRSSATAVTVALATSLAPSAPSGLASGDVMIAAFGVFNDPGTVTPPSGWNLIRMDEQAAGVTRCYLYYKVAGGSEPGSYTWSWVTSRHGVVSIAAYSGVDNTNPIFGSSALGASGSLSIVAPNVSTAHDTLELVGVYTIRTNRTFTPDGSMAERSDVQSSGTTAGVTQELADKSIAGTAGPGTTTAVASGTTSNSSGMGQHITLKTAGVSTPSSGMKDIRIKVEETAVTSVTVITPANIVAGDWLVGSITFYDTYSGFTPPAGWTFIRMDEQSATTGTRTWLYYRVATGSEAVDYTWSWTTARLVTASIVAYDADGSLGSVSGGQGQTSTVTVTAPTITPASQLLLGYFAIRTSGRIFTAPGGMTHRFSIHPGAGTLSAGVTVGLYDELVTPDSATGTRAAVADGITTNSSNVGQLLSPGTSGASFSVTWVD